MNLSERKAQILSAVAEYYIATGEPVGSKYLAEALPFTVSSATIRNEMAELSVIGLLEQPHTSAGRIPSDQGLRYYAEHLLTPDSPTPNEIFRLLSGVDHTQGDPEIILSQAAELLADLTGMAGVVTTPSARDAAITNVQVVPVGTHAALVLLTTSVGAYRSRIANLPDGAGFGTLETFYNAAAANFIGVRCAAVNKAMLQTVTLRLGERALSIAPLLTSLYDAVCESTSSAAIIRGQRRLLKTALRPDAAAIIELTADPQRLMRLLRRDSDEGVRLSIGRENGAACLQNASIVTLPYRSGAAGGVIGVLGPARMDYAHVIALLRFAAAVTGDLIASATAHTDAGAYK